MYKTNILIDSPIIHILLYLICHCTSPSGFFGFFKAQQWNFRVNPLRQKLSLGVHSKSHDMYESDWIVSKNRSAQNTRKCFCKNHLDDHSGHCWLGRGTS